MICPLEKQHSETLAFAWNCLMIITDMDKSYMPLYS
jgi:RNA polymerase subunit RPABC4/transcription elongation factor Spt4